MQRQLLNVAGAASIAAVNSAGVSADNAPATGSTGLYLILDVTALAGTATPSLQLVVEMKDAISSKYIALGTFTAVTATGTFTYGLGLGIGAAAEGVTATKNFPVPDQF